MPSGDGLLRGVMQVELMPQGRIGITRIEFSVGMPGGIDWQRVLTSTGDKAAIEIVSTIVAVSSRTKDVA